ncbi:hypothetical protein QTO30_01575 [Yoonia sp. GPGPB17]|uniref:hypothetical protein n=1 Tax=Yoonia sp. GPGPB17 TaxID=3026147 RepID=UPI0030BCBCB3
MTQTQHQRRRAFGRGIGLKPIDPEGDIGLDLDFSGPVAEGAPRDLRMIEGIDVLLQDLSVALTTGLGTDPLNTTFGSGAFQALADQSDPFMRREAVKVAVVSVLKADPRVRRILEVQVDDDPAAPGQRQTELNLKVMFDTILDERATLDVEGIPYG